MLYLLDKDVKKVKWNGIPLHEASSAIVKEEVNGDFVLTVHYPITDSGVYQLIKDDMLIKSPVPVLGAQLFRIKKPVENDDSLDITAYHITDDVMQRSINPVSVVGQGCAMALSQMVQNAKTDLGTFSFTSDIMDSRTFNTTETETLYSVLLDGKHSIVGTWEGELVRDNFALTIKRSRGADRGVVITTHKNLKSYQRTKNSQNVVTRIHARSTFRAEGAEDEVTLRVTVDSPLINSYPYINEKEYENNDVKTIDELKKWAEAKFKNEGIDKVSDAIEIEAYELDGQVIHLGDTVNIKSRKHDVDLYKKAIAYEYNALTEEYISITFDDKPGVGCSGVSSGLSNAADVILGVNKTAQEIAIERAVRNANQAFDAEFEKQKIAIEDGIEQAKAEAELYADNIKQSIDTDIDAVNTSMQAQSEEHDRQVADILSKTQSVESLANQAKTDAASALARANQVKTEAIADARAQVATVSQALNTAKTDLQNQVNAVDAKAVKVQSDATALRTDLNLQASKILEQAQAQTALTSRVTTVETLADGTRSTVAELSKTVSKATGDITSVTNRTKTVEDTLSQTRTQYEALTQTVNTQTGQIDSINRKTADLQSGIDGVNQRFENLRIGATNYIRDFGFANSYTFYENTSGWRFERIADVTSRSGYHIKATCTSAGSNGFHRYLIDLRGTEWQGRKMTYSIDIKASKSVRMRLGAEAFKNGYKTFDVTTDWQRFISTDDVNFKTYYSFPFYTDTINWAVGDVIYLRDPQLEDGTVATTAHASEEDLRSEIAEYKRTADQNYSGLQSTVSTLDGKVTQNKTEVNQTTTQLSNRLTSVEAYKDGETTRSQSYFEASKTETARQITAERTAISANYVAKSTYDENVSGTTLKLNEIKTTADTAKQNLATYQDTVDRKLTELTTSTQTLDGKINTASAKVDTVAGQIRTEISNVEGKIPTTVGGQNLLLNSSDFVGWSRHDYEATISDAGYKNSKAVVTADAIYSGYYANNTNYLPLELNTNYITSCWVFVRKRPIECFIGFNNVRISNLNDVPLNKWFRVSKVFNTGASTSAYTSNRVFYLIASGGDVLFSAPKLETGTIPTDYSVAQRDISNEISSVKTTITQTAAGVEQLSTSLSTTNNKVTTSETKISQLISDVSSKVSQTDYNTLTGRMSSAETAITQNATEISKRLTSTQVEQAITDKGYATVAVVENKVKETADSFSRTISETKALIPTDYDNQNLWIQSKANGGFVEESLPDNHITGQKKCYKLTNNTSLYFNIEPDFSPRLYQRVTFSAWVKYENVVQGTNIWNVFNCFKHSMNRKNSATGDVSGTDWLTLAGFTGTSEWKYVTYTYDYSADKSYDHLKTPIYFNLENARSGTAWVTGVKVELGSKATRHNLAVEDTATVTALHSVRDTVDSHTRTIGAVGETGSILDNVSKVTQTASGLVQEVSGANGLKTQVSTLAGSYAIKNLTNSGTVLNQLNLNKDGSVKIDGKLVQITGTTYIQDGVISSAKIADLDAGKIKTGTLDAARIAVNSIDGSKMVFDQAFVNKMTANEALFKQLFAQSAFITQVQAVTLSAEQIAGGIVTATNGAMKVNLNAGQILYYTNQAALKRVLDGYPTQFIKFGVGTQSTDNAFRLIGAGPSSTIGASIASFGANRNNGENNLDGGFTGVNIYVGGTTGTNVVDRIELASDILQIAHAASTGIANDPRGWTFENQNSVNNNYVFRPNTIPNSAYKALIGTSATPVNELYIDEAYIKGQRLGWILKDIANRIGHSGWANNIA